MNTLARVLIAASGLLALSSCSRYPYVYLINNSGVAVYILSAEGDADVRTSERLDNWFFALMPRSIRPSPRIASGTGRDVMWHTDQDARFEVQLGRCAYRFDLQLPEASFNDGTVLQLEADRRLYLIATAVWDPDDFYSRPVESLPSQRSGFPIDAASRRCE